MPERGSNYAVEPPPLLTDANVGAERSYDGARRCRSTPIAIGNKLGVDKVRSIRVPGTRLRAEMREGEPPCPTLTLEVYVQQGSRDTSAAAEVSKSMHPLQHEMP